MTEEVIPINSTSDLLAALRHPDAERRHAVCDAIAAAPEAVLAYPALDGRDVLDELVATLAELRPAR